MTREERLEKQKQRLIEMKVPEEDLHEQGFGSCELNYSEKK